MPKDTNLIPMQVLSPNIEGHMISLSKDEDSILVPEDRRLKCFVLCFKTCYNCLFCSPYV